MHIYHPSLSYPLNTDEEVKDMKSSIREFKTIGEISQCFDENRQKLNSLILSDKRYFEWLFKTNMLIEIEYINGELKEVVRLNKDFKKIKNIIKNSNVNNNFEILYILFDHLIDLAFQHRTFVKKLSKSYIRDFKNTFNTI